MTNEEPPFSRLILASQSSTRKRALEILGLTYECIPANIDEKAIRHPDPLKMAVILSEAKALAVARKEEGIIIGADAFLIFDGKVLEKPGSMAEAYALLYSLSGNKHTFVTGLAVYDTLTKKMRSSVATCDIFFRPLFTKEIED
ncbi:hypothetical protein PHSC3_000431 [Chlamydiales bacterium STE3]|nr:hypothetical protein PHSC3_000431 [Chlamydiales bacterium STE3]